MRVKFDYSGCPVIRFKLSFTSKCAHSFVSIYSKYQFYKKCDNFVNKCSFFLTMVPPVLVDKRDLLAIYLSGTYCHRTGTRPASCIKPQQPSIYLVKMLYYFICVKQNKKIILNLIEHYTYPRSLFIGDLESSIFFWFSIRESGNHHRRRAHCYSNQVC